MLTVLLATRNRSQILHDVLRSFSHLEAPPAGWKLVVVDNGSTDETAQVIASFNDRLPLHSRYEPKLGKNFALNTGLEIVEGDLVVFTDDDVFPHTDWLVQLRKAADAHLNYSMLSGVIFPRWEAPPPRWIEWVDPSDIGQRREGHPLGPVYTLTDPAQKEGPLPPYMVFGPNMAIRTNIFESGMRFDPAIGPRGANYPMGGETELVMRISRKGHKAWHVSGAVVEHLIRKEQLQKAWILERGVRWGRGYYRVFKANQVDARKLWMGIPRRLVRDLLKEGIFTAMALVSFRPKELFGARWRFNFLWGQAMEARNILGEQDTPQKDT
jgi:glycosyltransferase involved in cell wall biosynthesis